MDMKEARDMPSFPCFRRSSRHLVSFVPALRVFLGLLLLTHHLIPSVDSFQPGRSVLTSRKFCVKSGTNGRSRSASAALHLISDDDDATESSSTLCSNRRLFLSGATAAVAAIGSAPLVAWSADDKTPSADNSSTSGMVSPSATARRLSVVPTFTIVDKRGVPFMVFGEDAKLTAYFFTSYDEARRILDVAIASSDKSLADLQKETRQERKDQGLKPMTKAEEDEELGINPWREARISTVPLDFAVTLATKSGRQRGGSVYFRVSPPQETADDALAIDSKSGKTELAEGKVPLFYFEDFKIPRSDFLASTTNGKALADGTDLPDEVSPVYFSKAALLDAYQKSNKGSSNPSDVPEIKVSELMSVVTAMVDPEVKDDDLKSLAFVPPAGSDKRAKECEKKGGKEQPFIVGERIVAY
mmetsp:Transcript_12408/g.35508  ORF Transcript_12408/g.35508 Transcript_12408/m.35508 type:complete len:415 (-) Transcript_12408:30-1274(-)